MLYCPVIMLLKHQGSCAKEESLGLSSSLCVKGLFLDKGLEDGDTAVFIVDGSGLFTSLQHITVYVYGCIPLVFGNPSQTSENMVCCVRVWKEQMALCSARQMKMDQFDVCPAAEHMNVFFLCHIQNHDIKGLV